MNTFAAISVIVGCLSALIIAFDVRNHKQSMKIMNAVWILTGLWAGVLALIVYFWFGRKIEEVPMSMSISMNEPMKMEGMKMDGMEMKDHKMEGMKMDNMKMLSRPYWQSVTLSTLHCGAGCTLADLIGEWFLYLVAIKIGGSLLLGSVVIDYILALCIGVYFQYSAIKSMSSMPKSEIWKKAFKADVLSLTAWQVGMYGFMAIILFGVFHGELLPKTSWLFWFMMQLAMLAGFVIAFPVNVLLIKYKVKKAM